MDTSTTAPPASEKTASEPVKTPSEGAVMDVVVPPPAEKAPTETADPPTDENAEHATEEGTQTATKLSKPKQDGVTIAIVATVVIVLGLAVLATLAFIKTQK